VVWSAQPDPTKDKKFIYIDTMARWRIKDPLLFLQRAGKVEKAQGLIDGIIDSVVRDMFPRTIWWSWCVARAGRRLSRNSRRRGFTSTRCLPVAERGPGQKSLSGRLRKGREKITREMLADGARRFPEYGMELLDIRITRINYEESVQQKVFERMISERKRIAAQYRSEGEGERAAILGRMEKELAKIRSEAFSRIPTDPWSRGCRATRIYGRSLQ